MRSIPVWEFFRQVKKRRKHLECTKNWLWTVLAKVSGGGGQVKYKSGRTHKAGKVSSREGRSLSLRQKIVYNFGGGKEAEHCRK